MGTIEKKLTMRAVFGLLLFMSYPFCCHTGILKVSLSFLPLCIVFWGTNTYLTDSYFSSRPLKRWLHPGWYRTVLSLSWGEKKHPYVCDLFFTLSLKCFSIPFLTLKLVFKYCVLRHLLSPDLQQSLYIVGLASRQDALKLVKEKKTFCLPSYSKYEWNFSLLAYFFYCYDSFLFMN